ncbi:MAG: ubiquitin-conjugating enzyme E2 [Thermoplasmata archaeon]
MALPRDILRKRLKNEIQICKDKLAHRVSPRDMSLSVFPTSFDVELYGVPALAAVGDSIVSIYNHSLVIEITEEYPYQKPVVRWQTPIFHPNIMSPEDGGYVCTKLLQNWSFASNLYSFILSLEVLLTHPNPKSPHGTRTCTMAAEYFNKFVSGNSK